MTVDITPEMLDEVNIFVSDGDLVRLMNNKGLGIDSMSFILQALVNAIDDAQQLLDENENV